MYRICILVSKSSHSKPNTLYIWNELLDILSSPSFFLDFAQGGGGGGGRKTIVRIHWGICINIDSLLTFRTSSV